MSVNSWDDTTVGSVSRMNKTGVISGTGAYLASLDKAAHKLFHCTSTGSGFTLDHIYLCTTDGTSVIDLGVMQSHTHIDESSGGSLDQIIQNNLGVIDSGSQFVFDIDANYWKNSVSGTGSVTELDNVSGFTDQKILKTLTGATSGSGANYRKAGLAVGYSFHSAFQALVSVSSTSSINARWGYDMETITSADDNLRKYGFNLCTSVNGNWFLRSANGTTRSDSDMGVAFTTSTTNISAFYNSDTDEISAYIDFGNQLIKTSDVATSGSGVNTTVFKFGVKNSTAADKQAFLYKLRMVYRTATLW